MLITLDGGFTTTLSALGYPVVKKELWGAEHLILNPEAIIRVHEAFLASGADIIKTCTYQAHPQTIKECFDLTVNESEEVVAKAVNLARQAVENIAKAPKEKAGSVGPYGAALMDMSEYTGDYISTVDLNFLKDWHVQRLASLVRAQVDYIAFETIPSLEEGLLLIDLLKQFTSQKAWISFACKNGKQLCHGEYFCDAVKACIKKDSNKQLIAIGINCTNTLHVTPLLETAQEFCKEKDFIVYPNCYEENQNRDGCISDIVQNIPNWHKLGAKYIGGCCMVFPQDIKIIREKIDSINACPASKQP